MKPISRAKSQSPLHRADSAHTSLYGDNEDRHYELEELEEDAPFLSRSRVSQKQQRHNYWSCLSEYLGSGFASRFFKSKGPRWRRSFSYHLSRCILLASCGILLSIIVCGVFFPSYTYQPPRYLELRRRAERQAGLANVNNETVFIAASLYDHEGGLLSGAWAENVLNLVDILGQDNVFLSIYENNPDPEAQVAMDVFRKKVGCKHEIVWEDLDLQDYPRIVTAEGVSRLKRMTFLADVRNRALRPLENTSSHAYHTRFDKLLYLNDVMFDPVDAANLLFSTGVKNFGDKTNYDAACAVDFINPFKFYDTFAGRDFEGYAMGVPFYPWFSSAGRAESRQDVLAQKDAVRAKACWGGITAFDAKYFQEKASRPDAPSSSVRFREETDTYWESSECCLIHADIAAKGQTKFANETKNFINPYIRVAYDSSVFSWLSFTRRFERLYTPIHFMINWIGNRPHSNPRRLEYPGQEVTHRVWQWNATTSTGHIESVRRVALPGGFCGMRALMYINENQGEGELNWLWGRPPDDNL